MGDGRVRCPAGRDRRALGGGVRLDLSGSGRGRASEGPTSPPASHDRRKLLFGALGVAALTAGCSAHRGRSLSPASRAVPHQQGVTTVPSAASSVAAFDVKASRQAGLVAMLQALNRACSAAVTSPASGADTVTVGVGASLFDRRFGLERLRPRRLSTMPVFPNDALDPAQCHGDLLIQVCADRAENARKVMADLRAAARGGLRTRWQVEGFRGENTLTADGRPSTRDLFGFREGSGNPDVRDQAEMDRLVWVQPGGGEPDWAVGGTYQVVRIIRFATGLWDTETVAEQEKVFGRRKSDGAPLGHGREDAAFDYRGDPNGQVIPLDSHIRRANPRTPQTEQNRILRRGYSYRQGRDAAGHADEGLVFICFQQDLERGFATVQRRLAGEALDKYVLPVGGGYFYVLPGGGDYLGHSLMAAAGLSPR
ncbi:Dyp-type peroxidase [Actinoallomurus sp. CA-150999]|uniref:Dyp-type peroxidase n=1 Tax=Actinoallomurus sp. CA-150999 TaxID=3239887 RepID=UPI003D909667